MQTQPDQMTPGPPMDQMGAEAPMGFGVQHDMLPPDPVQEAQEERFEVEARDKAAVQLVLSAEDLAKAALVAQGNDDADKAAKYASAALDLIKAHVLLAPIEAADDLAEGVGSRSQTSASQQAASSASKP